MCKLNESHIEEPRWFLCPIKSERRMLLLKCCFRYKENPQRLNEFVLSLFELRGHHQGFETTCFHTPTSHPPHPPSETTLNVWKSRLSCSAEGVFRKGQWSKWETNGPMCGIFHQSDLFSLQMFFFLFCFKSSCYI